MTIKNENKLKTFAVVMFDVLIVLCSTWATIALLYLSNKTFNLKVSIIWTVINLCLVLLLNGIMKVYSMVFDNVGFYELMVFGFETAIIILILIICRFTFLNINISEILVFAFLQLYASVFFRFYKRILRFLEYKFLNNTPNQENVMIVGAGSAGYVLLREIQNSEIKNMNPVCYIDDNVGLQGKSIFGVKVVGDTSKIKWAVEKYKVDKIIIAIPSASKLQLKAIIEKCQVSGKKVQVIPDVSEIIQGKTLTSYVKDVDVLDLLGREPVKVNLDEIIGYISGKTVLVTGGGGSIGSELCRQIATHNPKQLIIFDVYENSLYDIEQELKRKYPTLNLLALVGSVRGSKKIEKLFDKYRPDIVFNAAAHKHVPLMETSPCEAIKNNVFGTLHLARAADKYGTQKFVQISTDKAVNPTNIMGASKRICEMIIQTIGRHSQKCDFVAVRFGNVLGSNGSVIPLFKKQIDEGGPVTITDKRIIRYFMTIPEAVSLVLQAGAYAKKGEIYVLDMGEPVKIYDLAINLIKLSGLEPYKDIDIKEIGLRPGEKLFEERLMAEEGLQKTANGLISIAKPIDLDEEKLFDYLEKLYDAAYDETDKMKEYVAELVPTYTIDKR